MTHKIVGSRACLAHFSDWYRPSNDIDIWIDEHDWGLKKGYDISFMPTEILDAFEGDYVATPNDAYTIKISHLPWPIIWTKHMNDALFLKSRGACLNEPLYALLKEHWKEQHGTKTQLSLYKNKSEFFDDAVPKLYDHDYLHELVSYPNAPVYTTVLKGGHEVFTDQDKWLALSFDNKVAMLREEMCVIMCERWLLHDRIRSKLNYAQAWRMSVEKTCTALTKGIYSAFICEHLEHFVLADKNETKHLFKILKGITL